MPPNPLSGVPQSSAPAAPAAPLWAAPQDVDWAGWESDEDDEPGGMGAGGDAGDEDGEPVPLVAGGLEDPGPPPARQGRFGPGGRRCIVAASCSSGVTLRFSDSNMLERSLSPLQWQQHARSELLSVSDVVNLNDSDCQQPFRSVE